MFKATKSGLPRRGSRRSVPSLVLGLAFLQLLVPLGFTEHNHPCCDFSCSEPGATPQPSWQAAEAAPCIACALEQAYQGGQVISLAPVTLPETCRPLAARPDFEILPPLFRVISPRAPPLT